MPERELLQLPEEDQDQSWSAQAFWEQDSSVVLQERNVGDTRTGGFEAIVARFIRAKRDSVPSQRQRAHRL